MNKYTLIGYFKDSPTEPMNHFVEANNVADAIRTAEKEAYAMDTTEGKYINTFVIEGHCNVLSTWAG